MATITLVASAFGAKATLYDALQCDRTASSSDLKKAYRQQALLHHPDRVMLMRRAADNNDDEASTRIILQDATLKFQAVSAAYAILMDPQQRRRYDVTGFVPDEEGDEDDDCNNDDSPTTRRRSRGSTRRSTSNSSADQQRWNDFFHSVFQELLTHNHGDAASYRGSKQEREDVLQSYETCKGDFDRMVDCIIHVADGDTCRWKRDIVIPAIERGEIDGYGSDSAVVGGGGDNVLVDSDDDDDDADNHTEAAKPKRIQTKGRLLSKKKEKKLSKKRTAPVASNGSLVDTEDDEETTTTNNKKTSTDMSRKNKMDYRVAKKRKKKAEREIKVASIFQSKAWSGATMGGGKRTKQWQSTFTDGLLSNMEKKYSVGERSSKKRVKKK